MNSTIESQRGQVVVIRNLLKSSIIKRKVHIMRIYSLCDVCDRFVPGKPKTCRSGIKSHFDGKTYYCMKFKPIERKKPMSKADKKASYEWNSHETHIAFVGNREVGLIVQKNAIVSAEERPGGTVLTLENGKRITTRIRFEIFWDMIMKNGDPDTRHNDPDHCPQQYGDHY